MQIPRERGCLEKWYWRTFGTTFSTTLAAPDVDGAQPARIRARVWGINAQNHTLDASFGPIAFPRRSFFLTAPTTYDTTFVGLSAMDDLAFDVASTDNTDLVGFAWADLFYQRSCVPTDNTLSFASSPAGGTWHYKIGPFATSRDTVPRVFDVTDPLAPTEILGAAWTRWGPAFTLRFRRTTGARAYRIVQAGPGLRHNRAGTGLRRRRRTRSRLINLRRVRRRATTSSSTTTGSRAAETLLDGRRSALPLANPRTLSRVGVRSPELRPVLGRPPDTAASRTACAPRSSTGRRPGVRDAVGSVVTTQEIRARPRRYSRRPCAAWEEAGRHGAPQYATATGLNVNDAIRRCRISSRRIRPATRAPR